MGNPEDIRWLRATANDLNNLIQVISESSKALKPLCATDTEALRYYSFLSRGLERAQQVTAQMAARAGGLADPFLSPPSPPVAASAVEERVNDVKKTESSILNPQGSGELVMVIDDEKIVLELATTVLIEEGYRVIAVTDVFKALTIYGELKGQIALVILDFTMPIMDGAEVFDELKKLDRDASIMLSSGFAEQDKVRTMLARGLKGFLPKPYTKEKLQAQVRSTLDAIRASRTGERRVL